MKNRILVINSEIQKAVSEIINYELQNPKVNGIISVLKVDTLSDLEYTKIYLRIFTPESKEDVFNAIKHSAGFIRRELSKKVDLRKVPYLQFYLDNSAEEISKIEKLISETKTSADLKDENYEN